ncbi:DUF6789 family protein [Halohasta salina]|uniref:DUF6789 family protein n=1 Tax=Halohasta salina TaxID=2961621 RepID=UPI0020A5C5EF|nr:DUF6789 family protein [Halohasta salina]
MNRIAGGILGGATGISVMSLLFLMLEVETREQIRAFDAVARYVGMPGNTFIGFVVFAFVGTVIWPLLFVAIEPSLPFDDPPSNGMILGTALWIAFFVLGRGDISGPLLAVFAGFTIAAHLAYGFLLGAFYQRFGDTAESTADRPREQGVDRNAP